MKKKFIVGIITTAIALSMSMSALAGQWQSDANGWWWQNDNGSYPTSTWQWIDGNNDGTAESYYFNEQGYCLLNTTTPDGYTVNPTGAWTVNGIIQTQSNTTPKLKKFALTILKAERSRAIEMFLFHHLQSWR